MNTSAKNMKMRPSQSTKNKATIPTSEENTRLGSEGSGRALGTTN
jgi:hypothetical protein